MVLNMQSFKVVVCLLLVLLLAACSGPIRKEAVPDGLTTQAVIPGMEDVRYRVGYDLDALREDGKASFWREMAYLKSTGYQGNPPPAVFLAVSGGGDNGAFGAGLLNGWTKAGDRPEFKLVTGVSTGALIAPFAFLGPSQDQTLKDFYTTTGPSDIMKPRSLLAAVTSDALADNRPLWQQVEEVIDQAFLDAIAGEHEKGRILLIATTDLDARQAVLWNMTKIAASGHPRSLPLFRSIMVASAAIPAAFPPVMIDVEAAGNEYQEMHVDGGTLSQVFVYPPGLKVKEITKKHAITRERRAYIIRNARLDPDWANVERSTMDIAERAISSLIHSQGVGDLYRIYLETQRDEVDFNLAYVPADFDFPHREEFDTEFMRALYQRGYDMATEGYPWDKIPPGF